MSPSPECSEVLGRESVPAGCELVLVASALSQVGNWPVTLIEGGFQPKD